MSCAFIQWTQNCLLSAKDTLYKFCIKINELHLNVCSQGMKVMGVLDIQNMPCAREAILHGAAGSLLAGIVHFLATSKWFS